MRRLSWTAPSSQTRCDFSYYLLVCLGAARAAVRNRETRDRGDGEAAALSFLPHRRDTSAQAECTLRTCDGTQPIHWLGAVGYRKVGIAETSYRRGSTRARGLSDQSIDNMAPDSSSLAQSAIAVKSAVPRSSGVNGWPRRRMTLGLAALVCASICGKSRSFVRSTYPCSRA